MFSKPNSIFQQRLQETIKTDSSKEIVEDLIRLHLFKNAEKNESLLSLVEVYDLLGVERFIDLISLLSGKTLSFPKKEDFKDTLTLAICYYYRNIEGKTWNDIKELLGDDELPTIKYGIRMQQLQSFLGYIGDRLKMKTQSLQRECVEQPIGGLDGK
jgi:hypothetical protein